MTTLTEEKEHGEHEVTRDRQEEWIDSLEQGIEQRTVVDQERTVVDQGFPVDPSSDRLATLVGQRRVGESR